MSQLSRNIFIELADPDLIAQASPIVQQLLSTKDLGIEGILAIAATLIDNPTISNALRTFSNELGTYPHYPDNAPRPHVLHLDEVCLDAARFYIQHQLEMQGKTITKKDLEGARTYAVQFLSRLLLANPGLAESLASAAEPQKP